MEGKREVQGQLEASLMLNKDLQKQLEASQYETQQRAHDFEVRVRFLLLLLGLGLYVVVVGVRVRVRGEGEG